MTYECQVVSYGLFVEDADSESANPRPAVADHLEKTVRDAQVPGASTRLSEPMVTGVSTDSGPFMQSPISLTSTTPLLTTTPSKPPSREDDTSIGNSNADPANLSESMPRINGAKTLNDQTDISDVEMKDI